MLVALLLGIPLGVYTGAAPALVCLAASSSPLSLVGVSLPAFLIGILLILIFPVRLGVAALLRPRRGGAARLLDDRLPHRERPQGAGAAGMTLGLFQMTLIMRLVRAEMLEVLRTDYIKFARARGLTNRAVNFGHALKNTLVPVITITGLQLGSIIAFAIITETVFQWPGLGLLFIQAMQFADIPVIAAYLLLVALHLRGHQPDRRSALCGGRSAPAHRRAATA